MKIDELFEAPIADISYIGDWNKTSSFKHAQDRKLLTNPKAVAKIKSMWKYPEESMFNVILVNHPNANKSETREVGSVSIEWFYDNMKKIAPEIEKLIRQDQVNIVYTNNNGSERVPMTGWIMAHRLGHAFMADIRPVSGGKSNGSYYFKEAADEFENQITKLAEFYGIRSSSSYRGKAVLPFNGPVQGLLREICTFKSAREHNLRNPFEAVYEYLAQYMLTGQVKFNPAPSRFRYGPSLYSFRRDEDADLDYANMILSDLAYQLKEYYETAIGYSEGEIFVM